MAFMMPVMKNNYDIYKDNRSRKSSECSNSSSSGGAPTLTAAVGERRRKVAEIKSESFSSSPSHHGGAAYRMQMQRCHSQRTFPRNSSRASAASALSPTRSFCQASSPPKTAATSNTGSQNDLSKFHLRLVEKLRKSFRKDNAKRS